VKGEYLCKEEAQLVPFQEVRPMPALLNTVDPDGLLEFSVVFTDRSLNHMSAKFQQVMRDISDGLRTVYNADGMAGSLFAGRRSLRRAKSRPRPR
jgi:hypothetical protein